MMKPEDAGRRDRPQAPLREDQLETGVPAVFRNITNLDTASPAVCEE
jgi:hypothetical protein